MPDMTPGTATRNLQQAQAAMRKARQALRLARTGDADPKAVLRVGWQSLAAAHRVMAEVPLAAATEEVMMKQIHVQRYATALLVRLRRLARGGEGGPDLPDDDDFEDDLD
jgi:hypothetical protein